ncbi:hypothetical protein HYU14_02300 [Candidatus Woesearchaeota archaeon]|nr:hypothetical protein [Candidatus Woesearchaeota archaeon]
MSLTLEQKIELLSSYLHGDKESSEAKGYLEEFGGLSGQTFALVKISGSCFDSESLGSIAQHLATLYACGAIPVITYGWGEPLNAAIAQENEVRGTKGKPLLPTHKVRGTEDRFTDSELIGLANYFSEKHAAMLSDAINAKISGISEKLGIGSGPESAGDITSVFSPSQKVILAQQQDPGEGYGSHNGLITGINHQPVSEAIATGKIPIISPLGISPDGVILNVNSATSGCTLAYALDPFKFIMVTQEAGVRNMGLHGTPIISEINLRREYAELLSSGVISGGMKKNVDEMQRALAGRPNGEERIGQIVGPGNLVQELFTKRGAGTFIKLGYTVYQFGVQSIDRTYAKELIEAAFGQQLKADYFEKARAGNAAAYWVDKGKGIAIVFDNPFWGLPPYLDVIAVKKQFAGNGMAKDLIYHILASQKTDNPKLFWRSKQSRDSNILYKAIACLIGEFTGPDGNKYNGYAIGLSPEEQAAALGFMQRKGPNFIGN